MEEELDLHVTSLNSNDDKVTFRSFGCSEFTLKVPNLGMNLMDPGVPPNVTTPEGAVISMGLGFAPWLNGEQLLKYYEERKLTEEQSEAIRVHLNEQAKLVPAEQVKELMEGGLIENKCPSHEFLLDCVTKIHPELESLPENKLFARLRKDIKKKKKNFWKDKSKQAFSFRRGYLHINEECTFIATITIRKAWESIKKFELDSDKAVKRMSKLICKRLD
jgi:hypothetical protein